MDKIRLTQIRAYGYTGFIPEEQVLGQWFEVDLVLWIDLAQAGRSDRLEETLDYRNVIATVKQLIQTQKFALVEKLATAIAESLLVLDSRLQQIQVCLTKPAAPIPDFGGQITIEIIRTRNA